VQDAYILAGVLGQCTDISLVESALQAYDLTRRPIATSVLEGSAESGKMYEFESQYGERYDALGLAINQQWSWIDATTPEEEMQKALNYLRLK
jgi:salicylate hydroxylase